MELMTFDFLKAEVDYRTERARRNFFAGRRGLRRRDSAARPEAEQIH